MYKGIALWRRVVAIPTLSDLWKRTLYMLDRGVVGGGEAVELWLFLAISPRQALAQLTLWLGGPSKPSHGQILGSKITEAFCRSSFGVFYVLKS